MWVLMRMPIAHLEVERKSFAETTESGFAELQLTKQLIHHPK